MVKNVLNVQQAHTQPEALQRLAHYVTQIRFLMLGHLNVKTIVIQAKEKILLITHARNVQQELNHLV